MKGILNPTNAGLMIGAGVFGCLFGSFYEKSKAQKTDVVQVKPSLPMYGKEIIPSNKLQDLQSKLSSVQNRTAEIMKYGFPSMDDVKFYGDYVLSYDRRTRVAKWVFEHMTADKLNYNKEIDRSHCEFTEDYSTHEYFRAKNQDYKGSGYDRGHLAAAGNHRLSQYDLQQTFLLSNIAPQVGVGFNRHSWNRLEKYVRSLTKKYLNVYVCTGPLYLPRKEEDGKFYVKYEVIGPSQVAVPTHFFKIIILESKENKLEMEAYIMPNRPIDDNTPLEKFMVKPDVIERNAGLLFFNRLSKDKLVKINGRKTSFLSMY